LQAVEPDFGGFVEYQELGCIEDTRLYPARRRGQLGPQRHTQKLQGRESLPEGIATL
jgi:hypothetical protein